MINPTFWHKHRVKVMLGLFNRLWWKFFPGVVINVRWPAGNIVVDHHDPRWVDWGGAVWVDLGFSSDPNEHYRPIMEKLIGKQGWDWDWCLKDSDIENGRVTIKIRQKYAKYAIMLQLKWN